MNTAREILVPHGAVRKICRALDKSEPTVRKALRYAEGENAEEVSTARKIRYVAIKQYGGTDTGAADMSKNGNTLSWNYSNGARLTISVASGFTTIVKNGKVIDTASSITTDQILDWQIKAEHI